MRKILRIEVTEDGTMTTRANVPIDETVGILEMAKFALMLGNAKNPTDSAGGPDSRPSEVSSVSRVPPFTGRAVA